MAIRIVGGNILLSGGSIVTNEICCCTGCYYDDITDAILESLYGGSYNNGGSDIGSIYGVYISVTRPDPCVDTIQGDVDLTTSYQNGTQTPYNASLYGLFNTDLTNDFAEMWYLICGSDIQAANGVPVEDRVDVWQLYGEWWHPAGAIDAPGACAVDELGYGVNATGILTIFDRSPFHAIAEIETIDEPYPIAATDSGDAECWPVTIEITE